MSNSVIEYLRSQKGEEIKQSASAVTMWLKPIIQEVKQGEVTADFKVRPEMTNPLGLLHGGVVSLILDDLISMAVSTLAKENLFVTANLSVDFFLPVRKNEIATAKAKVVSEGKVLINGEASLFNKRGQLLANAHAMLIRDVDR